MHKHINPILVKIICYFFLFGGCPIPEFTGLNCSVPCLKVCRNCKLIVYRLVVIKLLILPCLKYGSMQAKEHFFLNYEQNALFKAVDLVVNLQHKFSIILVLSLVVNLQIWKILPS